MARGFGSTFGAGTSDRLATTLGTNNNLRSYSIWINRHGTGGGLAGQMFNKSDASAATEALFRSTSDTLRYTRAWSTLAGTWSITGPAADVWAHVVVTYNSSLTTNDPLMYLNGVSQSVTEIAAPSGTRSDNAEVFGLGNRFDGARNWDGSLAEFAVWDRILNPAEAALLARGVRPTNLPTIEGLRLYVPVFGGVPEPELFGGTRATLTGTKAFGHPPVLDDVVPVLQVIDVPLYAPVPNLLAMP